MFEYFLILCLFNDTAPGGVSCERVEGPFYDQQVCIEKMVEQAMTTGIAACHVRYMEEIFDATETRKRPGNDQQEHIRT